MRLQVELLVCVVLGSASAVLNENQWEIANDLRDVVELLRNETRLEICNEKLRSLEERINMKTKNSQLREEVCNGKLRALEDKRETKAEICQQRLKSVESEHAARLATRELELQVRIGQLVEEQLNASWLQQRVIQLEAERRTTHELQGQVAQLQAELVKALTRESHLWTQLEAERGKSAQLAKELETVATQMQICAVKQDAENMRHSEREREQQARIAQLESQGAEARTREDQCQLRVQQHQASHVKCVEKERDLFIKMAQREGDKLNVTARAPKIQHQIWRPQLEPTAEEVQKIESDLLKQQEEKLRRDFPSASFPVVCPGKNLNTFKGVEIMGKVLGIGNMTIFVSHKKAANWTEALAVCRSLHMTPVEAHTKQKFDLVDELMRTHDPRYQYFVGASSEGRASHLDFAWVGSGRRLADTFSSWRPDSPTSHESMRCVKSNHFHPGQLYNWACSDGGYAVCQSCLDLS